MSSGDHEVLVLDDDPSILSSLDRLLTSNGYRVRCHSEPEELFRQGLPSVPACLLLDNQLGDGRSGADVHTELLARGWFIPTVFLTAHWDIQFIVDVMRAGADGFLTKPYDPQKLLVAVELAIERSRARGEDEVRYAEVRLRAASLTPREREVVRCVVDGLLNKEIADQLDIALVTVKVHRGRAMQKLGAGNPAELVYLAGLAGLIS